MVCRAEERFRLHDAEVFRVTVRELLELRYRMDEVVGTPAEQSAKGLQE